MAELKDLETISLPALQEVITENARVLFRHVTCNLVDCPNLNEQPFNMPFKSMCGQSLIGNIGSFQYLFPTPDMHKIYYLDDVIKASGLKRGAIFGPTASVHADFGRNGEVAVMAGFDESTGITNKSQVGLYDVDRNLPSSQLAKTNKFAYVGHYYISEDSPGQVIELKASGQLKPGPVITQFRELLTAKYGGLDRPVGLGLLLVLRKAKGKFHVLPDFPDHPLDSQMKIGNFLKMFEMDPPLIGAGILLSHNPFGVEMKLEHVHCYNEAQNLAGHFHQDLCINDAEYTFYIHPAGKMLCMDNAKL